MSRKSMVVAGVAAAALTVPFVMSGSASAQQASERRSLYVAKVVSKAYVGPLQFAVGRKIWVADAFTSTLSTVYKHQVYAHGFNPQKGGDLEGAALAPNLGDVAFLKSSGNHKNTRFVLLHNGKQSYSFNLAVYEKRHNPDGRTKYGTPSTSKCVANALKAAHAPVRYKGGIDSHPYAVAYLGGHQWAVADAGGNDVLKVDTVANRVTTLAVIPPANVRITKTMQQQAHLPACTVGKHYWSESVPTDVEVGPHGTLYISSLPGGAAELPGSPPSGRVFTLSPAGKLRQVGHGFADATNLAVTPNGSVYVAELGHGIALMKDGRPLMVLNLPSAVAVEWGRGALYASTAPAAIGGKGPGEILRLARR